MFKQDLGTPCPAPLASSGRVSASPMFGSKQKQASSSSSSSSSSSIFDDTFDQFNDNTTQNIAQLVQQEFKNAPPRRTLGLAKKPKRNVPVSIFEDGNGFRETTRRDESFKTMRGSAINARPAQKIRANTAKESASHETTNKHVPTFHHDEDVTGDSSQTASSREDRRRTIWIPSEDTTIMSIHPGAHTHTFNDDTIRFPTKPVKSAAETPRPAPSSGVSSIMRQSQLIKSAAPKRGPLASLPPVAPNAAGRNVMGSGGGKENMPPGTLLSKNAKSEKPTVKPLTRVALLGNKQSPSYMQQTAALQARTSTVKKRAASDLKGAPKAKIPATKHPRPSSSAPYKDSNRPSEADSIIGHDKKSQSSRPPPMKMSMPTLQSSISTNASRYPVLSNDLLQPELYEDNWLQHQEISLTQLVNSVFEQADQSSSVPRENVAELRVKFINKYHDPSTATLHKRVKASLLYGALSMPKDAPNFPRLREDIGLRRQFIDLFVSSYNLDALQAATETVVGRMMGNNNRLSGASSSVDKDAYNSIQAKELKRFFLTFFIRHEDATELVNAQGDTASEDTALKAGSSEWFWNRTVLRCLMLIHLLDQAKTSYQLSECLFQVSSLQKSSISILQTFARMMMPSVGDVIRPLGHMEYSVIHAQQPLEEYTYRIDNLAVDLRNGVLLTRFVELLLYPPTSLSTQQDNTVTFAMPDGETLTSICDNEISQTRILTQHLKFPCVGRVQKVHNVQVALSALANIQGLPEAAIQNIKAEDIVDGHREKTLSLLWSLVSRWGLGYLVDWDELHAETLRFSSNLHSTTHYSPTPLDINEQGTLLKNWAQSICSHHNIPITNLTTSFSNPNALAAIISTYADFIPASRSTSNSRTKNPVAEKLRTLGCSESFVALFASNTPTIPSRSNTIAVLAFLASRLLPLAKVHRAACIIQRTYKLRLSRRKISETVKGMKVARECAEVAKTRIREVEATVTLQRAWRRVLDRRVEALENDVLLFQSLARGWSKRCAVYGGGRRVMGGW